MASIQFSSGQGSEAIFYEAPFSAGQCLNLGCLDDCCLQDHCLQEHGLQDHGLQDCFFAELFSAALRPNQTCRLTLSTASKNWASKNFHRTRLFPAS